MARVRARARRKNPACDLGYLRARARCELEERWALDQPDDHAPRRVLLIDFDGIHPNFGEAVTIQRVSSLESPGVFAPQAGEFDGVVIGLQMAWLHLETILTEALHRLRPGGKLLFCTFGPDTLQELRRAWGEVDELPHVHPFIDLHLIGDQLLQCGFIRPIVDVDWVTVEYQDARMLYADLRGEGFTNILQQRRKTLTGKSRFDGFAKALDGLRKPGTPLAVTCEFIYGVAYAPSPSIGQVRVAPPEMI